MDWFKVLTRAVDWFRGVDSFRGEALSSPQ